MLKLSNLSKAFQILNQEVHKEVVLEILEKVMLEQLQLYKDRSEKDSQLLEKENQLEMSISNNYCDKSEYFKYS